MVWAWSCTALMEWEQVAKDWPRARRWLGTLPLACWIRIRLSGHVIPATDLVLAKLPAALLFLSNASLALPSFLRVPLGQFNSITSFQNKFGVSRVSHQHSLPSARVADQRTTKFLIANSISYGVSWNLLCNFIHYFRVIVNFQHDISYFAILRTSVAEFNSYLKVRAKIPSKCTSSVNRAKTCNPVRARLIKH